MKRLSISLCVLMSPALLSVSCNEYKPKKGYHQSPEGGSGTPKGDSDDAKGAKDPDGKGSDPDDKFIDNSALGLACEVKELTYKGLGDTDISVGTQVTPGKAEYPNTNQMRIKTPKMLVDSYKGLFNATAGSYSRFESTFGLAQRNWFVQSFPSAFTNYATFILGREVGQAIVRADSSWNSRTSDDEIKKGCKEFAAKAWSREVTDADIQPCINYMKSPALAALPASDRWSYGIASILSSIDFISF